MGTYILMIIFFAIGMMAESGKNIQKKKMMDKSNEELLEKFKEELEKKENETK